MPTKDNSTRKPAADASPPGGNGQHAGTDGKQAKPHNYARVFETFGVEFAGTSGDEAVGECPWCGKDRFHLNVTKGTCHCKHCERGRGNVTTFLTWLHGSRLEATTPEQYSRLAKRRGVAPQTLRRHELAYDPAGRRWLIPFRNAKGNVVNVQLYHPDRPKPNKFNVPGLPTGLYGFHDLAGADNARPVLLCEGPFDAIALDFSIGHKHRAEYVIVATPGALKEAWAEHFRDRQVRAFYHNDKGGEDHRERARKLLSGVAAGLRLLKWPDGSPNDVNDLIRLPEFKGKSVLGWLTDNCFEVTAEPKLAWCHGWEMESDGPEVIEWVWPDRMRCGSYVSFSGRRGTMKSTLMREVVATYTRGEAMPGCDKAGLPAGHVVYVTAEDGLKAAAASLKLAGAVMRRVLLLPATLKDGDPMNVLEHLGELRQTIRQYGVRFVVIDGQNSVVGAPCIATDMLARHNVTNKLHQFAQQENVCLVGIRNEDAEGRAYGPASMGDLGRCVLRAVEEEPLGGERYFRLIFERISDAAPSTHPPIPFSVQDLGGSARKILWGKRRPDLAEQQEAAVAGDTPFRAMLRARGMLKS